MIHMVPSTLPDHVQVIFSLPATIWADQIAVVGDFNQWAPDETPLHQDRDGTWRAVVNLPASRQYDFHYLVDGRPLFEYAVGSFSTHADCVEQSMVLACTPAPECLLERIG
jgi:1,4-alpha-glucan branching enzyme